MLEKFVIGLMQQAGITPQQITEAYQWIMSLRGEVDGFKRGSGAAMAHFNARLDALENMLHRLETKIDKLAMGETAPIKPNGAKIHVGPDQQPN